MTPRELWIEALESGEYTQTVNNLHDQGGYCCLGVACAVYIENGGSLNVRFEDGMTLYNDSYLLLPSIVQEWLRLRSDDGTYIEGGAFTTLTDDNDQGQTFQQIADTIRSAPKGLFHVE